MSLSDGACQVVAYFDFDLPVPLEPFWVRALAAADLADFDADFDPRVFPAFDAALLLVTLVDFAWAKALPAADLADFDADFDPRVFPAAEAADLPVFSLLATRSPFIGGLVDGAIQQ
jgi:hypothetical protein